MKISVGKKVEGTSNSFYLPDGEYEFQIVQIACTKGRVNVTFVTSSKQRAYKTFFLLDKNGDTNEKSYRELADFVTCALQIEDEEAEVDVEDALGYYVVAKYRNASYEKDGTTYKTSYINNPKRCDGFSDGTGSLLEEFNKRAARTSAKKTKAEPEEEVEETVSEEKEESFDSFFDGI